MDTIHKATESLSFFGFWGWLDLLGGLFVVGGCAGELWLVLGKLKKHQNSTGERMGRVWQILIALERKAHPIFARMRLIPQSKLSVFKEHLLERLFIGFVALGVAIELCSLPASLWKSEVVEREAKFAESNSLVLQTNLETLNGRTLELAHQYDMSTNALAEANARLASIKPLKTRLLEWLKHNMSEADMKTLERAPVDMNLTIQQVTEFEYVQLRAMCAESGADQYCVITATPGGIAYLLSQHNNEIVRTVIMTIKPALFK